MASREGQGEKGTATERGRPGVAKRPGGRLGGAVRKRSKAGAGRKVEGGEGREESLRRRPAERKSARKERQERASEKNVERPGGHTIINPIDDGKLHGRSSGAL
jgi:hypothetical protein